jgi:hypothetical protein
MIIIKRTTGKQKFSLTRWFDSQLYSIQFDFRELKWKVYNYFRSSQHWLIKKIPRTYQDKVELIPLILFEILIDFVEKEKGLVSLNYDHTKDIDLGYTTAKLVAKRVEREGELLAAYHFAKVERPLMEAELIKNCHSNYDAKEYFKYEELLHQKEDDAMMTIVKYSRYLWT